MYIGKGLALIVAGIVGLIVTIIWIVYDKKLRSQRESAIVKEAVSRNTGSSLAMALDVAEEESETESLFGKQTTAEMGIKSAEDVGMKVPQRKKVNNTDGFTQGLNDELTQGLTDRLTEGLANEYSDEITEGLKTDDATEELAE